MAGLSFDTLTHPELLSVLDRIERVVWRTPAVGHRIIARLSAESSPIELGAKNLTDVLSTRMRISRADARRRIKDATQLGPRRALSGQALPPTLAQTAAGQARGDINPEHVRIIRRFFYDLPNAVDFQTREQAEANLARVASEHRPDELRAAADRLLALIHPDGDMPTDAERARRRFLTISRQGPDGMSKITGVLDPEARATLDAVLAKWAAPGMCNPNDETPTVRGTPRLAAIDADTRSPAQRNHDALTAISEI